jgi:hypothetical protein
VTANPWNIKISKATPPDLIRRIKKSHQQLIFLSIDCIFFQAQQKMRQFNHLIGSATKPCVNYN